MVTACVGSWVWPGLVLVSLMLNLKALADLYRWWASAAHILLLLPPLEFADGMSGRRWSRHRPICHEVSSMSINRRPFLRAHTLGGAHLLSKGNYCRYPSPDGCLGRRDDDHEVWQVLSSGKPSRGDAVWTSRDAVWVYSLNLYLS